jgi:A/G-specific adenine glycosylase
VVDFFSRFVGRFPNIRALADADEIEVLKLWEGLGYYRRARQLHAAAKIIVRIHGGEFPKKASEILALPGIGRYTMGAILSIAFGKPAPILEANTVRVYSRLLAASGTVRQKSFENMLWRFAESIVPDKLPGDFNQALMELGSTICRVTLPKCSVCPVAAYCGAHRKGLQNTIPDPRLRIAYSDLHEAVVVVRRGENILIRRCREDERWGGLWDFPRFNVRSDASPADGVKRKKSTSQPSPNQIATRLSSSLRLEFGLSAVLNPTGKRIKHAVTRYRITLDCFRASKITGRLKISAGAQWVSISDLDDYPLSTTGRRIAKWIQSNAD